MHDWPRYPQRVAANEPVLSRATTLPASASLDPAIHAEEKERIFGRTWQLAARTHDLARPGDFMPSTVLDEPIVIARDLDERLRAFYNVCRHRAGQVALARGNRKTVQCHYHGWTYGLDGSLRAAPEMDDAEGFDKADFGLLPVAVDTWRSASRSSGACAHGRTIAAASARSARTASSISSLSYASSWPPPDRPTRPHQYHRPPAGTAAAG